MTAIATANPGVSLNDAQSLFVLEARDGYSCLGYRVVEGYIQELLARLGPAATGITAADDSLGSLARYEYYTQLMGLYARADDKSTWFSEGTSNELKALFERLRKDRRPVRLFYGDPVTGLDNLSCWDTVGIVGRTMGVMKSPILVPVGDCGGGIISTNCIVKVVAIASGCTLFKHNSYHLPELNLEASDMPGYPHRVRADGETQADFKTMARACNWVAFVSGEHNKVPL
jgi:hypothetical protein